VFGDVWNDPNEPKWNKDIRFPPGSLVFKVLMSDGTDKELPFMKGSPEWQAVSLIALRFFNWLTLNFHL